MVNAQQTSAGADLQYLKPFKAYPSAIADQLYGVWDGVKKRAPTNIGNLLNAVEERTSPLYSWTAHKGDQVLHIADSQVNTLVEQSNGLMKPEKYRKRFEERKEVYVQSVHDTANWVHSHLPKNISTLMDRVQGQIQDSASKIREVHLGKTVHDLTEASLDNAGAAYNKISSAPVVKKTYETAVKPAADFGYSKLWKPVHDNTVSTGLYKSTYNFTSDSIAAFQGSWPYKTSKDVFWPFFSPIAEPVYAKVTNLPLYKSALDELKPAMV